VLEPSVLARIPPGEKVSIERVTFPAIVADRGVFGLATDDYWIDTGKPDLYLAANIDLVTGRRVGQTCDAVAPGAHVDATASVTASVVDDGATVSADAVVERSVLLHGAHVGAGARVSGSVVMGHVGDGAVVVDSVLGAGAVVDAGEHLVGHRRPDPDGA
jgi:mannose-1-phosphate guanylyltransferase